MVTFCSEESAKNQVVEVKIATAPEHLQCIAIEVAIWPFDWSTVPHSNGADYRAVAVSVQAWKGVVDNRSVTFFG